jgi:hypothetical protein
MPGCTLTFASWRNTKTFSEQTSVLSLSFIASALQKLLEHLRAPRYWILPYPLFLLRDHREQAVHRFVSHVRPDSQCSGVLREDDFVLPHWIRPEKAAA